MSRNFSCVVIDDEPAPREILAKHIGRHQALSLIKSFDEAPKALNYLRKNRPDIIFLDIDMPGLSGLELINSIETEGLNFIFVTAHPQFATDAFDLDAVDYLSKPVSFERFTKSVKKALRRLESRMEEIIMLDIGKEKQQISLEQIDWIEADNYYLDIYGHKFTDGKMTVRIPLYKIEKLLPQDRFFKINRSVIVNLKYIKAVRNNEVTLRNGKKFTVSRSYKSVISAIEQKLILQ